MQGRTFCVTVALGLISAVFAGTFPDPAVDEAGRPSKSETAVLAGGCFWGTEAVFEHVKGVSSVVSGYAGGDKKTAHTQMVESGRTNHAESVKITYDPSQVTYGQLLKVFFSVAHDPTQLNRQGPDTGRQYRSMIFYANEEQKNIAASYIQQLGSARIFHGKIATELVALDGFYPAEDFLQHFSERNPNNPYVVENDRPKIEALKQNFPQLFR